MEFRGRDPLRRHRDGSDRPGVRGRRNERGRRRQAIRRKEADLVGWPQFLPDGKHFIYIVTGEKPEDSAYWIASIDSPETRSWRRPRRSSSTRRPVILLFVRDRTLVAQPFDASARKITGEPVPLAEKIGTDNVGLARFSVSNNGVLAYRTGETGGRLLWRDRAGRSSTRWGSGGLRQPDALARG